MSARRTKGVQEARQDLPEILEAANRGLRTIITKHGKPYAAVVPIDESAQARKGLTLAKLRGTGKKIWRGDAGKLVAALRDEW